MTPYEEGDPDSPILFIGEAPSHFEIARNQPLVGPAGKVFNLALQSAQLPRARCYILNVFEEMVKKPTANKGKGQKIFSPDGQTLYWTSTKGFTDAGRAASRGCLDRVLASRANVIVPMGGPALSLCLDSRSITKWRGSVIPAGEQIVGRKLVPTIHPAFPLHGDYATRFLLIADVKKAKHESGTPEIHYVKRHYSIDPSFSDVIAFLTRAQSAPAIDTDLELLNGQIDCLSVAVSPTEAISIPFLDTDFNSRWSESEEVQIWNLYARLISDPNIIKINQNIAFDLAILLWRNKIVPRGQIDDPMIAHSIYYPFLPMNLGTLCSMYTDVPFYKDDGELTDSPTIDDFAKRWEYNAKDSVVAFECWQKLQPMIDSDGYRATYDMTMDMMAGIVHMMVHGIKLDEDALLEARVAAKAKREGKIAQLQEALGRPVITEAPKTAQGKRDAAGSINLNSPPQLAKYFYGELGIKPYVNKEGNPTTDDMALARIARKGVPVAKLLQEYRGIAKYLGTYLEVKYDPDKRVRTSFKLRGTWTGRLSSSKTVTGVGLNFQNLDDAFSSFLVSDLA